MREIKFRVWVENKEEMQGPFNLTDFAGYQRFSYRDQCGVIEFIDPVMQYTGLLDKNNKEIYEGDILRAKGEIFDSIVLEVKDIHYLHIHTGFSDLEIIGNIYENSELLQEYA